MKKAMVLLATLWALLHGAAMGEGVCTLGGSEMDVILDVSAMPDGGVLLAGHTRSSDGTLSDRTKRGQTGWLCCTDANGKTRWNFCSRQAHLAVMRAPVVHADGTITALLSSTGNERNLVELIRLNAEGEVLSRKTIVELGNDGANCPIENPGVFAGGYVLAQANNIAGYRRITYRWFDFEGNEIKTVENQWDSAVMAVSERHIIEAHDGAYWLCSLDKAGNDTRMCRLFDSSGRDIMTRMTFTGLVTMEDGGAAACMYQGQDSEHCGRLIRFDADGGVRYQLDLGSFRPDDLRRTDGGFALTGMTGYGEYALCWFCDEAELLGMNAIASVFDDASCPFDVLADGRAAVACMTMGNESASEYVNYDVALHMADRPQ